MCASYTYVYNKVMKELLNNSKHKDISKILKKGFSYIGDFVLNTNNTKSLIRLQFLDSYTPKMLKRYIIYTYCIVKNNNIILKFGYTTQALREFAGYGIGNGGRPSISRTGIHYIIASELYNNNTISFYYQECPKSKGCFVYTNIFGDSELISDEVYINPKLVEKRHIGTYKELFGTIPPYNKQENGRKSDWCETITNIHKSICTKTIIEYSKNEYYNDFMKLYHWKHNNIELCIKI